MASWPEIRPSPGTSVTLLERQESRTAAQLLRPWEAEPTLEIARDHDPASVAASLRERLQAELPLSFRTMNDGVSKELKPECQCVKLLDGVVRYLG